MTTNIWKIHKANFLDLTPIICSILHEFNREDIAGAAYAGFSAPTNGSRPAAN
jgi:hypothetical protein